MELISKLKAEITKVKIIGDIIYAILAAEVDTETKEKIETAIKENNELEKPKFVLEVISSIIHIDQDLKSSALISQAFSKIQASITDVTNLNNDIDLDFGEKQPHFGNGNKVNQKIENPTKADAIAVIGNFAELITLGVYGQKINNFQPSYNSLELLQHSMLIAEDLNKDKYNESFNFWTNNIRTYLTTLYPYRAELKQYLDNRLGDLTYYSEHMFSVSNQVMPILTYTPSIVVDVSGQSGNIATLECIEE